MDLFRNTLGPAAWTLVALVPPAIFALYFLRLRREPVEVPSTYLWTKVIEDLHVNSLWQKLRRSLLLLLQLLLAGLAILALLRPGWQGDALTGRRFIFLVDRSASMSTIDVAGRSRLDAAKSRVGELIDQLDSDMSAMIIAFDDRADVVQEFTGNRRQLREALERVTPSAAPTNIRTALELAAGFTTPSAPAGAGGASVPAASDAAPANGGADSGAPGGTPAAPTAVAVEGADPIELYILSDGRFGAVEEFALGKLRPKYLPLGETTTSNLAITSFNTRRNDLRPTQRQAFVQVANYSDEPQTAAVSLLLDGKLRDAAEVAIPAGDVAGATFNLGDIGSGKLEARLTPPAEFVDPLELDNRAYAVLDRPKLAQVLMVTPGNRALELGLSTARVRRFANVKKVAPDVLATPDFQVSMQTEAYDLVIFDQCAPATAELMPAANTLFVGRLPPLAAWRNPGAAAVGTAPGEGADADGADAPAPSAAADNAPAGDAPPTVAAEPPRVVDPQIIDWQRGHPLLNLVELGNVRIVDSLVVRPPIGGKLLVDSTRGPLMSIAPRESYEDAVLGFEIVGRDPSGETTVNTNWPRKHSFPNFCLNLVQYLGEGSAELQVQNNRPGEPVELELTQRGRQVSVVLPDKSTRTLRVPATGNVAFHETEQLGVYDVIDGAAPPVDQLAGRFAVNLFDRSESDVRVRARQDAQTGLRTVESLAIGYDDVAAESAAAPIRKELWTALLLAALAVLLIEWYIYNRRVYI